VPPVLFLKLLELPHLIQLHPRVLLLPAIERLFRNPHQPDQVRHRHPKLSLFNTATICSIENRFFFMANSPPFKVKFAEKLALCLVLNF
jgi:hypothetical protein